MEHPDQSNLLDQAKLRPFNLPILLGRYMRVTNHYVASDILDFDAEVLYRYGGVMQKCPATKRNSATFVVIV